MRVSTAIISLVCALGFTNATPAEYPFQFPITPATVVECPPTTNPVLLKVEYVNIDPNPPRKGQPLTIDGGGYLQEDIVEGAEIEVVVKLGLIKLLTKRFNFCEESVKVGKPCPIVAGKQSLKTSVDLPREIPPGKFTANIKVTNPKKSESEPGKIVTCLIAKAQFGLK
ncbi:Phosphatidylglycerol/phosphatidylinositol transfer protein [Modicella reniformis]|uniref:Phosphatidylglycerol/phosphatidylinositol transfer protein n=1 Tax=Modicella reniformis TaxID=1440133 RepID=A0A9P6MGJ4_9FUNG|nr:Phosphatidylglycerol/phosphatidylinositol transfer protein [Modicella reniformis]